jgi:hypothetical protein
MPSSPDTSSRFRRAAAAERERLLRQREKLAKEVARHRASLTKAQSRLTAVEDRIDSLERLAGIREESGHELILDPAVGSGQLLRGAAIRETAVRVLATSGQGQAPIHYRDWLRMVEAAGYEIAGQRPDGVFLNQVVRSPVVRASTQAGIYELDYEARSRLKRQLADLLAELGQEEVADSDQALASKRQEELVQEIRRVRRALEEAERSLPSAKDDEAKLAA